MNALRRFDLRHLPEGGWLAGVDEAGRGALAGPVVAGAVFVQREWFARRHFRRLWGAVNDSKQLCPAKREALFERVEEELAAGRLIAASGAASVREIEERNILGATRLAMQRALETACPPGWELPVPDEGALFAATTPPSPGRILIDGKPLRPFPYRHEGVVQGDGKSLVIALASIVAKVTRDRCMAQLEERHPAYGFGVHKGYATPDHRAAILDHGPCAVHRPTFLRNLLGAPIASSADCQGDLFG